MAPDKFLGIGIEGQRETRNRTRSSKMDYRNNIGSNKTEKKQTVWHYQQTKAIAKQAKLSAAGKL